MSPRRQVPSWLRLGISGLLLAILINYVDLTESLRIINNAQPALLLVLFTLLLGQRFFSAYRWFILLHGKNPAITFVKVIRLTFISVFLGAFIPGGTELARIYLLSKTTSDLALTVSSMIVERALALLALFLLVVIGLLAEPPGLPSMLGYGAWIGLVLIVICGLMVMHPKWRKIVDSLLVRKWLVPIRERLAKVYIRLDAYANQPWLMIWSMVLAVSMQLLRVWCTVIGAWALGVKLPLIIFVVIVPIIFLIALIPISIGGLGVREAAFVSLLGLAGVSAEAALTLSLLLYVFNVLTTLPGAFFYVIGRSSNPDDNLPQ